MSKFNTLFTQKVLKNGTQGRRDSNPQLLLLLKAHSVPKSRLCLFLKSQQITLTIKRHPYLNTKDWERCLIVDVISQRLDVAVHTLPYDSRRHHARWFCENHQTLTDLSLSAQNHNIHFTTKLLRIHRMPPINSDDYFYSFIGFLASPQCLHIAGEISAFYLPSVAHFRF